MAAKTIQQYYGDSEGPLGLPMPSDQAKALEKLLAGLDAGCKSLIKDGPMRIALAAKIDADLEPMTEVSWISANTIDRDQEVILPGGGDFKGWLKNPNVTWAHEYDVLPLGRGLWIKRQQKGKIDGIIAKTEYLKKPEGWEGNWFGDAVWHAIKAGFLPGKSIGFIPTKIRKPEEKEIRERPELAAVSYIIAMWHLLEYSVVPVGSNMDALVTAVGKGIKFPSKLLSACGVALPNHVTDAPAKKPDAKKYISVKELEARRVAKGNIVLASALSQMDAKSIASEVIDRIKGRV